MIITTGFFTQVLFNVGLYQCHRVIEQTFTSVIVKPPEPVAGTSSLNFGDFGE